MKKSTQQHSSAVQTTCRLFKMAPLALAVSLASMAIAPVAQATDLDIYKGPASNPDNAETSVMMLFDVSNTMAGTDQPKSVGLKKDSEGFEIIEKLPAGVNPNTISGYTSELGDSDAAYDFDRYYYLGLDGKIYYRRIDKVKMSLYHILDIQRMPGVPTKSLQPNLAFGLSVTPNLDNDGTASDKDTKSAKGYILAPAYTLGYVYPGAKNQSVMPLNDATRDNIRKANLPIASSNYAGWTHKDRLHDAIRRINVDNRWNGHGSYNPLGVAYMETAAYLIGTGTDPGYDDYSGMKISADDSVNKQGGVIKSYKAPDGQGNNCGTGKGIFVLTTGPGKMPARIDGWTTYTGVAKQTIGGQDDSLLYCGSKDGYKPGWDALMENNAGFRGTNYSWLRTSPSKQWYCASALTRVMRGLHFDHNVDYRYDRENSKLFGTAYKSNPKLKDKTLNILTASIGFGTNMEIYATSPKVTRYNHKGEKQQVVDCSRETLWSANNSFFGGNKSNTIPYESFCLFTEETYSFGEGGLYTGNRPEEVADALNSFISKIPQGGGSYEPMSTGTMSVPFDSLNQLTPRTSAYLPILEPKVDTEELWPGNLKKYSIKKGTIVGKTDTGEDKKVFTSRQGFFAKDIKDEWNTNSSSDEGKSQVGGAYQQILKDVPTPTVNRKTLIDFNGQLKDIKVEASQPQNFNNLNWNSASKVALDSTEKAKIDDMSGDGKINTIKARVQEMKQQLVNFLGYPVTADNIIKDGEELVDTSGQTIQQTQENRVLGGVLHSRPQLVTYDAVLDKNGSVASRKDYLLYGSFDGALHMVDDDTGEELFNFIPRQVLQRQGKAFSPATNQGLGDPTEAPYLHGVDGEWAVFGDYRRKVTGEDTYGIKAESMFAVGGLRMGGSTYYALDITNKDEPKLLYSVGSDYALSVGKGSFTATGEKNDNIDSAYSRMGLSWGKPNVAYVKKGGERVMVSLLPGGYDECYEDPHFELGSAVTTNSISGCNGKASAQGNAVYMVKLAEEDKVDGVSKWKTDKITGIGDALWWASSNAPSSGSTSMKIPDMKHSIVNEILALDGNYDGLTDHLYFSDLGGQVWRVDINNDTETDDFSIQRVVKVFDASSDAENIIKGSGDSTVTYKYSPRMYDTPLVTFQRLGKEGKIHGVVTVGTGDRSNPLDTEFSNNHIYTFIDKDLARYRNELFCEKEAGSTDDCMTRYTEDLTPDDLIDISYGDDGAAKDSAKVKTAIDRGISGETSEDGTVAKAGWKYKLVDNGFTAMLNEGKGPDEPKQKPKGLKMLNRPDALSGRLYTTIFSPEFTAQESEDSCAMSIAGLTNRERLCLPYGYCFTKNADGSSSAIDRGTVVAGGGIVDNYVGYTDSGKDEKGRAIKKIGVLDTFCEGEDCERPAELDNLKILDEFDVNRSFNPLKWFDR